MREDRADHERMMSLKAPLKRFFERRDLGAQLALGEIGKHGRVGRARDERVEHRAPGLAKNVRRDAVQLDAGVLQGLVQPVSFAFTLSDLRLAIPRQRPQPPLRLGCHKATAQQPRFHQLTEPHGVADVGLAARDVLDVRALHSVSSKSSSRICQTGCQYTPVASIATCLTRCAESQPCSAIRPCTVV